MTINSTDSDMWQNNIQLKGNCGGRTNLANECVMCKRRFQVTKPQEKHIYQSLSYVINTP